MGLEIAYKPKYPPFVYCLNAPAFIYARVYHKN